MVAQIAWSTSGSQHVCCADRPARDVRGMSASQGHGESKSDHECQQPKDPSLQRRNVLPSLGASAHAEATPDLARCQDDDYANQENRQQRIVVQIDHSYPLATKFLNHELRIASLSVSGA